jgi:hypothetical protein
MLPLKRPAVLITPDQLIEPAARGVSVEALLDQTPHHGPGRAAAGLRIRSYWSSLAMVKLSSPSRQQSVSPTLASYRPTPVMPEGDTDPGCRTANRAGTRNHPICLALPASCTIVWTWTYDLIGNAVVAATALPVATLATGIADRSHRSVVANPQAVYRSRFESQAATQDSATMARPPRYRGNGVIR